MRQGSDMSVWTGPSSDGHEVVVHHQDEASGLRAIVAIHARCAGRGVGGCRMRAYGSEDEALSDVLRLSRAMSYKAAVADVGVGGAKSVIIGDPRRDKSEALLRAMGRLIQSLGGAYVSAPDSGIGVEDLRIMREETPWVLHAGEGAGPSAPFTALGLFEAMRSAVRHRLGRDDLSGLRIALQGVGSVGMELGRLLVEAGSALVVADVNEEAARTAAARYGAEVVPADEILEIEADLVAPNAYGGVLERTTIGRLRTGIVCGAANNQLSEDSDAIALHERGILYVPDYVVNAGGMIAGIEELHGFDHATAEARVRAIGVVVAELLTAAAAEGIPPAHAADRIARARIDSWRAGG